jgi:ABC-type amino acid transport substrate-binding protein
MTKEIINIGRPLGYLCVAGVLALGALLLPGGAAPDQLAAGAVPSATSAPPSPTQSPACAGVRESLRPTGPLPTAGAMPPGSTMAAIAGRGRLIAGVDQGKFLAGYRDPQTGQLVGADIDIVASIAKAILGDPDKVQFVVLDIADRVQAVQRGEVDLVVDHFTVTCDRQRSVEFSSAYMTASQRLLVPGRRPRACCAPCRCGWTWCRGGGSRTAWSRCSGAGCPRSPATTSSWRDWPRRTRRRRSSAGRWTTRRTASGCGPTSPIWCGSSTRCSSAPGTTAASPRATSGG